MSQTDLVLFLLGLWVYIVLLELAKPSPVAYSMGFFDSCFGGARKDPAAGKIPAPLNAVAAGYVAAVYGDVHLPHWLRRTQAMITALWVIGLYAFLFGALVAGSGGWNPVLSFMFIGWLAFFLVSGLLWLVTARLTLRNGILLWRRPRAMDALRKIQSSTEWPKLIRLLQSMSPEYPVWWPYSQGRGTLFRQTWKILRLAVPIAMGVVAFFHTSHHWVPGSHRTWLGKLLMVLAFAVEWTMLAVCLVHWGDWEGAKMSTNDTLPLHILLKDVQDLRI